GKKHERYAGDDAAVRPGNLNVIVVVLRRVAGVDDVAIDDHVHDAGGDVRHEHQDGHTHQHRDTTKSHGKPPRPFGAPQANSVQASAAELRLGSVDVGTVSVRVDERRDG